MTLVPLRKIFAISHGNKFDLNKMNKCTPGDQAVAFIGRSGERNGLVGFVDRYENSEPFERGLITVALGGSALSSFVQPRPFYTAQNIDVLRPLSEMSLDEKLYYCLCIEANRFRYSTFGREANITLKMLPVPESVPAWVNGSVENAVKAFCNELQASVGA
jgi:Type I restriction modification DNA specificity domain